MDVNPPAVYPASPSSMIWMSAGGCLLFTIHANDILALLAGSPSSVTVTMTLCGLLSDASSEIVPEMRPVEELIDKPLGKPVAL